MLIAGFLSAETLGETVLLGAGVTPAVTTPYASRRVDSSSSFSSGGRKECRAASKF